MSKTNKTSDKKRHEASYLDSLRHSAAHLLAAAVLELWPKAKNTIGPSIENGFYYDFDFSAHKEVPGEADLERIEKKMHELVEKWENFEKEKVNSNKAKKQFNHNEYKKELIKEFEAEGQQLTLYKSGGFIDLCRGGHVEDPKKELKHFKLLSIAGAYWRGDEKNPMLTRIYGTAWPTKGELDDYLNKLEEAKKRDHRKLGKELGLFLYSDLVGPGLPLYKPKGGTIIGEIEKFMKELQFKMGYSHVYTPNIAKDKLYSTSGHLQWFKDGMYPPMEFEGEGSYYAKPMNCPFHIEIFKSETVSYKDLPIRMAEFGTVYRYEQSGEISGLLRTRGFTQDDAHIFCRENQVVQEFLNVFNFTHQLLDGLGLKNYWHRLSLKGEEKEKYAGNDKQWEKATELIRQALSEAKLEHKEAPGEAAFYGPKLDIIFNDSIGRDWQISTIQVDFLLPERFDLNYINNEGNKERPYMIHRAPLGSRERIMAVLIEHYAGNFPVWLSPVQVKVLPITDRNLDYTQKVVNKLKEDDIRVEIDDRSETLGAKIRDAQKEKVPYMLILGDKEESAKQISVRIRSGEVLNNFELEKFIEKVKDKIKSKALDL
jgi:threonyl-tRNA synthetase